MITVNLNDILRGAHRRNKRKNITAEVEIGPPPWEVQKLERERQKTLPVVIDKEKTEKDLEK